MKKTLIHVFSLCCIFTLGTVNFVSAQCENFIWPEISPGYYIEACEADLFEPIMLEVIGTYATYAWSTGETTPSIQVFTSGFYEVTVTDMNGCGGVASSDVIIHPFVFPEVWIKDENGIVAPPMDWNTATICEGDSITLSASVYSSGYDPSQIWSYSWERLEDGWNSGPLFTPDLTVATPGTYVITIEYGFSNQNGVCFGYGEGFYLLTENCQSCEVPTNESVEMTTPTTAFFDWDDMPDATFYQVKYRLKGTSAWSTVGASSSQRSVANLATKKYYQYKVRAQCGDEWTDFTPVTTFYTSQCDMPTGLTVTFSDANRMRVRWDNNPDEIKGKVRYREVGGTWTTQNSANGNNYLWLNNLPTNATIQYAVRSNCDGNDWSAYTPKQTHDLSAPRLAQEATVEGIQLYPNPAKDVLTVEFETIDGEETNIIITDNLGKTIRSQNGIYGQGIQRENIDIANLTNGYYFITIRSNDNVETQKFMKMK